MEPRLLMAQILQEWRFGSPYQAQNQKCPSWLLRAKETWNEWQKTVVLETIFDPQLPGGPVVETSPSNEGGTLDLWLGKLRPA